MRSRLRNVHSPHLSCSIMLVNEVIIDQKDFFLAGFSSLPGRSPRRGGWTRVKQRVRMTACDL